MLFTPKLVMPERFGRGASWLFVALMGAALAASLLPGDLQPVGVTVSTGAIETGLAHGVMMLADLVNSAWRETVREVTKVLMAVLNVLHS